MQIRVKKNRKWTLRMCIPTFLLFNRLNAFLISTGKENLTYRQVWTFMWGIRKYRRKYGKWKLVEIQSADGREIEITI